MIEISAGKTMSTGGVALRLRGNILLLITAFIWGTTFVAQQTGMDKIGPFTYAAARYFLGTISLLILWLAVSGRRKRAKEIGTYHSGWMAGIGGGLLLFIASSLQQVGIQYTTVGKASFITCLYIVMVPIFAIMLGHKLRLENAVGALLAITGLYFLCIHESLSLEKGDFLVFLSSFFWTAQILFIDRFASTVDNIDLALGQTVVTFIFSVAAMLFFERFVIEDVLSMSVSIAYAGVLSTGVAYTLQIIGQRYAEPAAASIIMSLESVFGALGGWVVLGQGLEGRELLGCMLMFSGTIVTQLSVLMKKKKV